MGIVSWLYDSLTITLTPPMTIALLVAIFVVNTWHSMPDWFHKGIHDWRHRAAAAREKLGTKSRGLIHSFLDEDDEKDANDDLAHPTAILSKMRSMFNLAYDICDDMLPDDMPWYKLSTCFMSMIHFQTELALAHPNFKREEFSEEGTPVSPDELKTLLYYLDFAQWAYEPSLVELQKHLRKTKFVLMRHDTATEPGRVGHFMAVCHERKQVILAIKGTNTLSDVLTDILGEAVPHTIDISDEPSTPKTLEIRCHEGIYTAALMMLDETLHIVQKLFVPQNYGLTICGHSLGAGVASLLGIFLKGHLPPSVPFRVYAYATPPCVSLQAGLDCRHYITTVVNNTDCVPRLSLMNLRSMQKLFLDIDAKLQEKGLSPEDITSSRRYLRDLMKIDSDLLFEPSELRQFIQDVVEEATVRQECLKNIQLFCPGRVVSLWINSKNDHDGKVDKQIDQDDDEKNKEDKNAIENGNRSLPAPPLEGEGKENLPSLSNGGGSSNGSDFVSGFKPGMTMAVATKTTTSGSGKDTKEEEEDVIVVGGRVHHGGMKVLRQIYVETTMVSDHSCDNYRQNLTMLLEREQASTSTSTAAAVSLASPVVLAAKK